jgi:two-component system chemotaxis response regulator CheY
MLHVVAVDDNGIMQQLLSMTFSLDQRLHGHVFATGADALDYAINNRVDLFVIDWNMPGGYNGKRLLETLRAIPRYEQTPIVVLSGDEEINVKLEARVLGATGWIVKPFNPGKLRNLIYKLLGLYSGLSVASADNIHVFSRNEESAPIYFEENKQSNTKK